MAKHDVEAFHFPEQFRPVPGLLDEVDRLRCAGRNKSALDEVLRKDGKSAHAFTCALALCSGRTARSESDLAEPITPEQLSSPYLAPIATECARCLKFWYSIHNLLDGDLSISNPLGLQC